MVIIRITLSNINLLHILSIQWIYASRKIHTIKSQYFPRQRSPIRLCNQSTSRSLLNMNLIFIYRISYTINGIFLKKKSPS